MTVLSWFAVYFVVWWVCLFAILPIGARNQVDAGEIVSGSEPGAPARLKLWPKLLANSVLAGLVLVALYFALSSPLISEYWR